VLTLRLARSSLANRAVATALTVSSIGLSVALLVGIENVRNGMRESFSSTVSRTDLIVGARGGTIQMLLYSVFGMGSPTSNISYETYRAWSEHPAVAWTIPYALGDSHRGFRVIGTNESFYEHYRYRDARPLSLAEGRAAREVFDLVLGATVADELGYGVGDEVPVTHGLGATGLLTHGDKPFRVVGILARTSTPVDRALYVTLEGIEAIHIDWQTGGPPLPGTEVSAQDVLGMESIPITQITSFFVGAKSRAETLFLQREVNQYEPEPLTAIIPGLALAEMWRGIGYAEQALGLVAAFVVVVGLLGMLVSIYTSLDARRREIAILRAVGVGPWRVGALLVIESGLLAALGAALGLAATYVLIALLQPVVDQRFGLFIPLKAPEQLEVLYLTLVVVAGFVLGLIPALKAYRTALHDGLTART
jgi:putative ABC transport system permease protein